MKFSLFAIAALAAATSSSCIVSATATAAAVRKRKIMKKGGSLSGSYGATGPSTSPIPIGGNCFEAEDDCVIPPGLEHRVGSWCEQTSDCVVQTNLNPPHAVCCGPKPWNMKCQRGVRGDYCGQNSDCQGDMKCHGKTYNAKCR